MRLFNTNESKVPNVDVKGIKGALKHVESVMGVTAAYNTAKNIYSMISHEFDGIDFDDDALKAMGLCVGVFEKYAKHKPTQLESLPEIECGLYRHYKGSIYYVLGMARHSETYEPMVMYKELYEGSSTITTWTRPYSMFFDVVEFEGNKIPRFVIIKDNKGE